MTDARPLWALGLMSGTSLDGVDAALVLTDGESVDAFGPTLFRPYTDAERDVLRAALGDATAIARRDERPGAVAEAERIVTDVHAAAVSDLLAKAAGEGISADVVGFHGQTVFHAPDRGLTVQIGDAARLSSAAGLPVVHDFRAADVAAGGQGAPLVPVYHRALASRAGLDRPAAILNVGGVANVTLIDEAGGMLAFDTGPGNALIDDCVARETGARFDQDGSIAADGVVNEAIVGMFLAHPFFQVRPPKSLDRMAFHGLAAAELAALSFADRVATLTAVTAATVALGLTAASKPVRTLVVAGGGARNRTLMGMLAARTGAVVASADSVGLSGDFLEAQAFGFLAVRRLRRLPGSYPGTTGVPVETIGGVVTG
ncbi:anhydro-N-acetylmuramic acid kinase [Chthonobacter rhizosphaerae]|uniref:anhydro-N-acetylmuramic acid kinase n=1 Tax=Chthonobacter rhizosphaerae TaxID=2735553 RepID=UPI0015EE4401|nr:anhydro-N-acetylmuramic acid kinase [Chthonobacter rhizosphaerae]